MSSKARGQLDDHAYPPRRGVREGKAKARREWAKLKPSAETQRQILAALEWQRNMPGWQKQNGEYIPMASTYLSQRRYEDEPFHSGDLTDLAWSEIDARVAEYDS